MVKFNPNVMVLGGRVLGSQLGHGDGGPMNEISALIKETRELARCPSGISE